MSEQLNQQKQQYQIKQIQLETLAQLPCVKQFLDIQESLSLMGKIIQDAENASKEGGGGEA